MTKKVTLERTTERNGDRFYRIAVDDSTLEHIVDDGTERNYHKALELYEQYVISFKQELPKNELIKSTEV